MTKDPQSVSELIEIVEETLLKNISGAGTRVETCSSTLMPGQSFGGEETCHVILPGENVPYICGT